MMEAEMDSISLAGHRRMIVGIGDAGRMRIGRMSKASPAAEAAGEA
jgi:hypothetical protein